MSGGTAESFASEIGYAFTCHGKLDLDEPINHSFVLWEQILTLLNTKSNQPNARFFFLSSCHHLRDKDAVILSKAVFSCLMQDLRKGKIGNKG